jgi:hypothetical protein
VPEVAGAPEEPAEASALPDPDAPLVPEPELPDAAPVPVLLSPLPPAAAPPPLEALLPTPLVEAPPAPPEEVLPLSAGAPMPPLPPPDGAPPEGGDCVEGPPQPTQRAPIRTAETAAATGILVIVSSESERAERSLPAPESSVSHPRAPGGH